MDALFANFEWRTLLGEAGLRAALLLVIGVPAARLLSRALAALAARTLGDSAKLPTRRLTWYLGASLVVVAVLQELGFDLGVLLGAAGVLTVALGFASQTSAANLISGLFLMADRSFVIGDVLDVEGVLGEVISIDLLSVKLRTFDNLMVRVPNEALVKARFTNLTRFPIRRLEFLLALPHDAPLDATREALLEALEADPTLLEEPPPELRITGLSDRGVELQLIAWVATANVVSSRTSTWVLLKRTLEALELEPAAPRRELTLEDRRSR